MVETVGQRFGGSRENGVGGGNIDELSTTSAPSNTEGSVIGLSEGEYARYLRNDTPHVRQHLSQWNAVYKRYAAEICDNERSRMHGGRDALRGANICDISTIVRNGRYTACVNLHIRNGKTIDDRLVRLHICNFLPVVIGSSVDLLQRLLVDEPNERRRYGEIYMFNMFWVFNSFLCTESKLFHEYRSHRRAMDDDNGDSCIRAYIYDRNGKGHMLFTRNNRELWLRDCCKREIRLIDENGGADATIDDEIVRFFVENALTSHPSFQNAPRDSRLIFRDVRDYMLRGVSVAKRTNREMKFGDWYRQIDDLENKRIASAPALYVEILHAMSRSLTDIATTIPVDDERSFARAVESCVMKYATASHRADLKPYISRKTVLRVDWSDIIKRQVKMDMRRTKRIAASRSHSGGNKGVTAITIDNDVAFVRVRAPDISQNFNQTQQQFLCSKVHDNTEFDYEQVKRMRVVNINSTKNLGLPERSERFFSPCNTGSISKAGRVINRTHTSRETFFVDLPGMIGRVTAAVRRYFTQCILTEERHDDDSSILEKTTILAVNEIPVARLRFRMHNARDFRTNDRSAFWRFFRAVKSWEPMCCTNVVSLRHRDESETSMLLDVRVANGVPMVPVDLSDTKLTYAAVYCADCKQFKSVNTSAKFHINADYDDDDYMRKLFGNACTRHVWCSRRELDLYEQTTGARLDDALYHEMACRGSLLVSAYQSVTDISKMIVSISAFKRSLDAIDERDNAKAAKRALANGDSNGRKNWLRVKRANRRYHPYKRPTDYIGERGMLRLFFAFGDFDMRNCEDGYVIDRKVPFSVDSVVCCRFSLVTATATDERVSFLSRMRLEYALDRGVSLYLGTFRSWSPITFSPNNAILVYQRPRSRDNDASPFEYDVYFRSNVSFLQIPVVRGSVCLFRTCQRSHTPIRIDATEDRSDMSERYVYSQHCANCDKEHRGEYCQPIREVSLEIHGRIVRLKLHLSDTRQTIKLQNSFGQKGVAQFADLSDLTTEHGEPVHIIASMFSLVGRSACGQLLEQRDNEPARVYSRSSGRFIGYGGYGHFFVSDDSPHNNFIYSIRREGDNPIRMCRLTYEALLENNVSSAAFVKASEFESGGNNPFAGMPRNVSSALRCYNMYDRAISLASQRVLALRRRAFDAFVVDRILNDMKK